MKRFDPVEHAYWSGERRLCGVTETLVAQGILPDYEWLDPYYRERGSAVHHAIALDVLGQLDEATVGEAIAPFLARARRILELLDLEPVFVEQPLFDPLRGYGGMPDLVGRRRKTRRLLGIDWKSGDFHPGHAVQLAGAYRPLLINAARDGAIPVEVDELLRAEWAVIPLTAEVPRPVPIERVEDYSPLFYSALAVHQWRRANLKGA